MWNLLLKLPTQTLFMLWLVFVCLCNRNLSSSLLDSSLWIVQPQCKVSLFSFLGCLRSFFDKIPVCCDFYAIFWHHNSLPFLLWVLGSSGFEKNSTWWASGANMELQSRTGWIIPLGLLSVCFLPYFFLLQLNIWNVFYTWS